MTLDLRLAVSDDPVGDYPLKITCPPRIHKERTGGKLDKTSSLAVYPDSIHCYGCGYNRMGVWGLADLLGVKIDEARRVADHYSSEAVEAYRERAALEASSTPLPPVLARLYNSVLMGPNALRAERQVWLQARGLTPTSWERFDLGHDGKRFVIPVYAADGNLLTLRYRRDDAYDEAGPKYSGMKGRNGLYLYPEPQVAAHADWGGDYLWVVEGELDAVRLWQEGQPAITATNGAGQAKKLPALIRARWPNVRHLLIATDQDEPGEQAAQVTLEAAVEAGFDPLDLSRVYWPEGKDITEALALGYDYQEAITSHFGG